MLSVVLKVCLAKLYTHTGFLVGRVSTAYNLFMSVVLTLCENAMILCSKHVRARSFELRVMEK